jgi:hypothetical protein
VPVERSSTLTLRRRPGFASTAFFRACTYSTIFFRSLSLIAKNGGMPFSGRPFFTTGMILSPSTSCPTSSESVRSGPLWPPVASRP